MASTTEASTVEATDARTPLEGMPEKLWAHVCTDMTRSVDRIEKVLHDLHLRQLLTGPFGVKNLKELEEASLNAFAHAFQGLSDQEKFKAAQELQHTQYRLTPTRYLDDTHEEYTVNELELQRVNFGGTSLNYTPITDPKVHKRTKLSFQPRISQDLLARFVSDCQAAGAAYDKSRLSRSPRDIARSTSTALRVKWQSLTTRLDDSV